MEDASSIMKKSKAGQVALSRLYGSRKPTRQIIILASQASLPFLFSFGLFGLLDLRSFRFLFFRFFLGREARGHQ